MNLLVFKSVNISFSFSLFLQVLTYFVFAVNINSMR